MYQWLEEHSRRLAVVSGVVLALLMVLWLSITTRTAMYFAEIEKLEQERLLQVDQINHIWADLGEQTAQARMMARAQAQGFRPAALEFVLVDKLPVSAMTATMSITTATAGTSNDGAASPQP